MPKAETKAVIPMQPQPGTFTREQVELLKRTVCKGSTDDELKLFMGVCQRTGLDPFARQIYAVKRWDSREKRDIMVPQTSIDGFRLIADRTDRYEGQEGPFWCGPDGVWHDVWIPDEPPVAARVGVLKARCRAPFWSVAKYSEYVQHDRDGKVVSMWRKMKANQLAKCAEALSLRKAFPQELSGLYTGEEMPSVEPTTEARPWRTFKEMLDKFAQVKAQLGPDHEHVYYEILQMSGVQHANEFRDGQTAHACYSTLQQAIEEMQQAQPETEATDGQS